MTPCPTAEARRKALSRGANGLGVVLLFLATSVLSARAEIALRGDAVEAAVGETTGAVSALRYRGGDLLSAPLTVAVTVLENGRERRVLTEPGVVTTPARTPGSLRLERESAGHRVSTRIEMLGSALRLDTDIAGAGPLREVTVEYLLPCLGWARQVFWAAAGAPFDAVQRPPGFLYGHEAELPLVTVYDAERDVGLSVMAPLELRKPELTVALDWDAGVLRLSFRHLRFGGDAHTRTGLWLVCQPGCWRPGLAWMLERYPSYFETHPRLLAGEGLFAGCYLRCDPGMVYPQRWQDLGASWVESHSFWPFYGLYVPDREPWCMIPPEHRKTAADLEAWEKGEAPGLPMTGQWMRDYIRAFHERGIQYYAYVNTTEAWLPYADKYFADSVVRRTAAPEYGGMAIMNAYEGTAWGAHAREQVRRTVECFPEQDGLFLDQNCYRTWHVAGDDGVSMLNGKPCCQISFAQEQMLELMHRLTAPHGMAIWTNFGGVGIECARYVHGIMSEAGRPRPQRLQYLCLARPMVIGFHAPTDERIEERFKLCLACAAFPPVFGHTDANRALVGKYVPLLNKLRGRRWVLYPHALELPDGLEGNIFSVPDGDYAVTLIAPDASQLRARDSSAGTGLVRRDLPIRVRVPDAGRLRHAYAVSGDYLGPVELPLQTSGDRIELTVPAHLASTMIVLTPNEPPDMIRTSPPVLTRGMTNRVCLRLRGREALSTPVRLSSPWGTTEGSMTQSPGNSLECVFRVAVPDHAALQEADLRLESGADAKAGGRFSSRVVPQILMTCSRSVFCNREDAAVTARVINHTDAPAVLALQSEPAGVIETPQSVPLPACSEREVVLPVRAPLREALVTLSATVAGAAVFDGQVAVLVPRRREPTDLFGERFAPGLPGWQILLGDWTCSDGCATGRGAAHWAVLQRPDWRDYGVQLSVKMDGSTTKSWVKCYLFLRLADQKNYLRFGLPGQIRPRSGIGYCRVSLDRCRDGQYVAGDGITFRRQERHPYRRGEWLVLRAEVAENRFRGYVDGQLRIEADLSPEVPRSGGMGIGVQEDHMTNHYRDLIVYPLTPAAEERQPN